MPEIQAPATLTISNRSPSNLESVPLMRRLGSRSPQSHTSYTPLTPPLHSITSTVIPRPQPSKRVMPITLCLSPPVIAAFVVSPVVVANVVAPPIVAIVAPVAPIVFRTSSHIIATPIMPIVASPVIVVNAIASPTISPIAIDRHTCSTFATRPAVYSQSCQIEVRALRHRHAVRKTCTSSLPKFLLSLSLHFITRHYEVLRVTHTTRATTTLHTLLHAYMSSYITSLVLHSPRPTSVALQRSPTS